MRFTSGSLDMADRKSKQEVKGNFIISSIFILTAFKIALSFFALQVIFSETSIK